MASTSLTSKLRALTDEELERSLADHRRWLEASEPGFCGWSWRPGAASDSPADLEDVDELKRLSVGELGPALGVHGGPGTLLVTIGPSVSLDDLAGGID